MEYKGPNDLLIHVCEQLITVALISLLVLMVPALAALGTLSDIEVNADFLIPLVVRPADILFLLGQLMVLLSLWMYFRCFIPYVSERPSDHLLSLLLAAVLCLNNFFSLLDPMLPLRGAFVTLVLLLTLLKDMVFVRRFPKSPVVRGWRDRVLFTAWTGALSGGVAFGILTHPAIRERAELVFDKWYDIGVQGSFYFAFLIITAKSFLTNYRFFQNTWKGAASIPDLHSGAL